MADLFRRAWETLRQGVLETPDLMLMVGASQRDGAAFATASEHAWIDYKATGLPGHELDLIKDICAMYNTPHETFAPPFALIFLGVIGFSADASTSLGGPGQLVGVPVDELDDNNLQLQFRSLTTMHVDFTVICTEIKSGVYVGTIVIRLERSIGPVRLNRNSKQLTPFRVGSATAFVEERPADQRRLLSWFANPAPEPGLQDIILRSFKLHPTENSGSAFEFRQHFWVLVNPYVLPDNNLSTEELAWLVDGLARLPIGLVIDLDPSRALWKVFKQRKDSLCTHIELDHSDLRFSEQCIMWLPLFDSLQQAHDIDRWLTPDETGATEQSLDKLMRQVVLINEGITQDRTSCILPLFGNITYLSQDNLLTQVIAIVRRTLVSPKIIVPYSSQSFEDGKVAFTRAFRLPSKGAGAAFPIRTSMEFFGKTLFASNHAGLRVAPMSANGARNILMVGRNTEIISMDVLNDIQKAFVRVSRTGTGASGDEDSISALRGQVFDYLRGDAPLPWHLCAEILDAAIHRAELRTVCTNLESKIKLPHASTYYLHHEPSAGGTTMARQALYLLADSAICLWTISGAQEADITSSLKRALRAFNFPIICAIDDNEALAARINRLIDVFKHDRVVFFVVRRVTSSNSSQGSQGVKDRLQTHDAEKLLLLYQKWSPSLAERVQAAREADRDAGEDVVDSVFYFALAAFNEEFKGIRRYVRSVTAALTQQHGTCLASLSIVRLCGGGPVPVAVFGKLCQGDDGVPLRRRLCGDADSMLGLSERGFYVRHPLLAHETIRCLSQEQTAARSVVPLVTMLTDLGVLLAAPGSKYDNVDGIPVQESINRHHTQAALRSEQLLRQLFLQVHLSNKKRDFSSAISSAFDILDVSFDDRLKVLSVLHEGRSKNATIRVAKANAEAALDMYDDAESSCEEAVAVLAPGDTDRRAVVYHAWGLLYYQRAFNERTTSIVNALNHAQVAADKFKEGRRIAPHHNTNVVTDIALRYDMLVAFAKSKSVDLKRLATPNAGDNFPAFILGSPSAMLELLDALSRTSESDRYYDEARSKVSRVINITPEQLAKKSLFASNPQLKLHFARLALSVFVGQMAQHRLSSTEWTELNECATSIKDAVDANPLHLSSSDVWLVLQIKSAQPAQHTQHKSVTIAGMWEWLRRLPYTPDVEFARLALRTASFLLGAPLHDGESGQVLRREWGALGQSGFTLTRQRIIFLRNAALQEKPTMRHLSFYAIDEQRWFPAELTSMKADVAEFYVSNARDVRAMNMTMRITREHQDILLRKDIKAGVRYDVVVEIQSNHHNREGAVVVAVRHR